MGRGFCFAAPLRQSRSTIFSWLFHYLHQSGGTAVLDAIEIFFRSIPVEVWLTFPGVAEPGPDRLVRVLEIHRRRGDAIPGPTEFRYIAYVVVVGNRFPQLVVCVEVVNPIPVP